MTGIYYFQIKHLFCAHNTKGNDRSSRNVIKSATKVKWVLTEMSIEKHEKVKPANVRM